MTADAVLMFLAGTDTTAHALTFGSWEMMKQPQLWTKLRKELSTVLPHGSSVASLKSLETLPYLVRLVPINSDASTILLTILSQRAVIKESLRISMGTSARLARVVPSSGTTLCDKQIPSGTRVSFSHYVYNNDPAVFKNPFVFDPDRWLGPDVSTLEAHMISFSRGGRSCIGMNLAYAELNTTFAHLVRRFDLLNDGTTEEDMDWTDTFTPRFKGTLKVKLQPVG